MHGFIYEWTNSLNGLKYLGRHQGTPDDGYVGSGTVFRNSYNRHPETFTRAIIWESNNTSTNEILQKEEEFLSLIPDDELYYGVNRKYYNQVRNSAGYTSEENPMRNPEVVARMMATREEIGTYKNPWDATIEKYGYDEACRLKAVRMIGNKNGIGNKGSTNSAEHNANIAASIQELYVSKKAAGIKNMGGRKRAMDYNEVVKSVKEYGFKDAADKLEISVAAMKGRYYNAVVALKK